jgi:hypothetical protein
MNVESHPLPGAADRSPRRLAAVAPALSAVATLVVVVILAALAAPHPAARAQAAPRAAELFRDADLALGERLIREHACAACHARRVGGDGSAIYRPKGRISTPGFLRGMVEQCNSELNLGLFPEEVTAVAAVINRDHYRFD